MRQDVYGSQDAGGTRKRKILLTLMRQVGKPYTQTRHTDSRVRKLRQTIPQVSSRDRQESGRQALLHAGLLVCLQPERQPLPLDWWAGRPHESGWDCMAQGCASAGQISLPYLPCAQTPRGASHLSVWHASGTPLGTRQRDHALPQLPHWIQAPRDGVCRDTALYGVNPRGGLVC